MTQEDAVAKHGPVPTDLGGFQQIIDGVVADGDLLRWSDGMSFWATELIGHVIEAGLVADTIDAPRVYRRMPVPRQGGLDHDAPVDVTRPHHSTKGCGANADSGLKDSGVRTTYSTGAQRDGGEGKGRFDLLPFEPILAYAKLLEKGAKKYAARNWEQGVPISRFFDGALRHLFKAQAGLTDEDHLAAVIFNVGGIIYTRHQIKNGRLPKELDDMPAPTHKGEEF